MKQHWAIGITAFIAGAFIASAILIVISNHSAESTEESNVSVEEMDAIRAEIWESIMEDYPYHEPFNMGALESRYIEMMAPDDIPVGSWWTDGHIYFKVLSNTPDTLYMAGTNLEEACGMEITFVKHPDSTMVTEGASVFAFHNSLVLYDRLRLADGKDVDMLVAFYDPHCITPQAVLQRYHGRGLENQQVIP